MYRFLFCVLLSSFSGISFAESYKTILNDGSVVYSDRVVSKSSIKLNSSVAPVYSDSSLDIRLDSRQEEILSSEVNKNQVLMDAAQEIKNEATKKSNCAAAKKNLELLEKDTPLMTTNDAGEKSYISDVERARRHKEEKENIKNYCN